MEYLTSVMRRGRRGYKERRVRGRERVLTVETGGKMIPVLETNLENLLLFHDRYEDQIMKGLLFGFIRESEAIT